jgi:flagellar biosynthesis/type III secretory pathway M-ring protein FliF/YscJ
LNPARVEVEQQQAVAAQGEQAAAYEQGMPATAEGQMGGPMSMAEAQLAGVDPNNAAAMIRRSDATHDQKVDMARTLVMDNPAGVANVVKNWVGEDQ